jgi:chromosome segregation ATPase
MSCDKEKDEALTELQKDYAAALARVEDLENKLETALKFVAKYNNKEISFEKDDNRLEVLVTYFDSICEKDNSEAETTLMAVVENPSVDSSDVVTPSKKVAKLGNFEKSVIENYNLIVERDGLNAAEKFLASQGRYLPRGFHPSKL